MSELRVDAIKNSTGGAVSLSGANITGVATITTFSGTHISVSGIVTATDFNSTSDINLKENIKPISSALDKLIAINGVEFDWKENKSPSIGVIAQEVEKVFPNLVKEVEDHKTINYNGLIGVLVEAVKEQQNEILNLKKRIEKLESQ